MRMTISPRDMQALEQQWMRDAGVPSALLMEHAAMAVCDALSRLCTPGGTVLFLCGPGNNGGDGFAAARIWQSRGGRSRILQLSERTSGDAEMNLRLALGLGIPSSVISDELTRLPACDAVCDALFGTGLCREVTGEAAWLIRLVNESGLPVCAVDIPSGLNGMTGRPMGCAIHAAETVTFHRLKTGLTLGESADYTGRITIAPILIPETYGEADGLRVLLPQELPALLPCRRPSCHKGANGRVVILAGSPGMAGAAALCAGAAIRAGAGLTRILCRSSILSILQVLVPGATCTPLPERDGVLTDEAAGIAAAALTTADAAAVGPGLGQAEDLLPLLNTFRQAACPVVWDADALNMLASHRSLLPLKASDIITPHPGEAQRLLGDMSCFYETDTMHGLLELANCRVLLKGARTLMSDGSRFAVNITGTPAMAKGGSGDVLTGLLTGLMGQHLIQDPLT